jgi:hypothetical protein
MKFFILGDSWGVGEWTKKSGIFESIPNTGLDYHLSQLGHTVTNISAGSAGNFGQLRHAYWTLKENSDYDYIVWFHTESMRDIEEILIQDPDEGQKYFPDFDISNFESGLDYLDFENYKYAQTITDEYKIPFIVIGGQCLVNPVIDQFSFAQHIIHSWLAELLNLNFTPPKNTFFSWDKIKRILNHYNIDEKEFIIDNMDQLDKSTQIKHLAKSSPKFPDSGHPSSDCFKQLAQRILKMLDHAGQS